MLRSHARAVATSIFMMDLTLTIFSFIGTYALMNVPNRVFGTLLPLDQYLWLLLFIVPVWSALLQWNDTYQSHRVHSPIREIGQVARAVAVGGIALFAFVGLTKSSHISRPFLAAFTLMDLSALILLRV